MNLLKPYRVKKTGILSCSLIFEETEVRKFPIWYMHIAYDYAVIANAAYNLGYAVGRLENDPYESMGYLNKD